MLTDRYRSTLKFQLIVALPPSFFPPAPLPGVQRVLESQPQFGVRGCLKDLVKVIWGA